MPTRTPSLLAALGQNGALEVVVVLLQWPRGAGVGPIQEATGLSQATVTRRLQELSAAGLLDHLRRGYPYRLREPERVSSLLRDSSELSEHLLEADADAERAFQARVRPVSR